MTIYIIPDENNYITEYSFEEEIGIAVELPTDFDVCGILNNPTAYKYENGSLTADEEKLKELQDARQTEWLRAEREYQCFSIINRGELWYSRLTEEQLAELNAWYDAWLDVTESRTIPDRPTFLDEV